MIYWVFFAVLAFVIIGYRFRPGGKYRAMVKQHDRCASCRTSLRWTGTWRAGQFDTVCHKCGAAQPR
jgi:hypothetical protein